MDRRNFMKLGSSALAATSIIPSISFFPNEDRILTSGDLLRKLVERNDTSIPNRLESQLKEKGHRWYGGVKDRWDIPSAGGSAGLIKSFICAYVSETSKYYKSEVLLNAMIDAANYLINIQYRSGTIDLHTTNFHSTPDTGFTPFRHVLKIKGSHS